VAFHYETTIYRKEIRFPLPTKWLVELRVIWMKDLLENSIFVYFLMIGLLQMISTAEGIATHFFNWNLKYHGLSYIDIAEPRHGSGTLNLSKNYPSHWISRLWSRSLSAPSDIEKFVMINGSTCDWYLFDRNSAQKSVRIILSNEYEKKKMQLINVCFLDEFISSHHISDKAHLSLLILWLFLIWLWL
jgi:hypothetical protein